MNIYILNFEIPDVSISFTVMFNYLRRLAKGRSKARKKKMAQIASLLDIPGASVSSNLQRFDMLTSRRQNASSILCKQCVLIFSWSQLHSVRVSSKVLLVCMFFLKKIYRGPFIFFRDKSIRSNKKSRGKNGPHIFLWEYCRNVQNFVYLLPPYLFWILTLLYYE